MPSLFFFNCCWNYLLVILPSVVNILDISRRFVARSSNINPDTGHQGSDGYYGQKSRQKEKHNCHDGNANK